MKAVNKLIILIISSLIIISCKEYNPDHKKFVFSDIKYGKVIMYTNSGINNDLNERKKFLNTYSNYCDYNIHNFTKPINIPWGRNDEIEILSSSKARIKSNNSTIYFDLIRKNGILYFQALDTIENRWIVGTPDLRPYYMKPDYAWDEDRLSFAPFYKNLRIVAGIGGVILFYELLPCIFAVEKRDEIHLFYTTVVESNAIPIYIPEELSPDGYYYQYSYALWKNIPNNFNEDYLKTYHQNDTLRKDTIVYQNNRVIFKSK